MTWRVILGTVSMVLTVILLGFVAVTEQSRMESFTEAYKARQIEAGAALFEGRCVTCHGDQGQGFEGVAPALNSADLLAGSPLPPRLVEISWTGTTADYIRSAIAGGRPRASAAFATYPQRMPTWGEEFGGPLRKDQVNALVAFIMNWADQYETTGQATAVPVIGVGTDITVELPAGDPAKGEAVSKAKGCVGCHIPAAPGAVLAGPGWLAADNPAGEGVGTRAGHRFSDTGYAGGADSAAKYLFESIVQPSAYLVQDVPTYVNAATGQSIMPANYGSLLSAQDVADIIAYLETLK